MSLHGKVKEFMKNNHATAWRGSELAQKIGIDTTKVSTALSQIFAEGMLTRCSVAVPGLKPVFEYRWKAGAAITTAFREMKPAPATIVPRQPTAKPKFAVAQLPGRKPGKTEAVGKIQGDIKPRAVAPAEQPRASSIMSVLGINQQTAEEAPRKSVEIERGPGKSDDGAPIAPVRVSSYPRDLDNILAPVFSISHDGRLAISAEGYPTLVMQAPYIKSLLDFITKTQPLWGTVSQAEGRAA